MLANVSLFHSMTHVYVYICTYGIYVVHVVCVRTVQMCTDVYIYVRTCTLHVRTHTYVYIHTMPSLVAG